MDWVGWMGWMDVCAVYAGAINSLVAIVWGGRERGRWVFAAGCLVQRFGHGRTGLAPSRVCGCTGEINEDEVSVLGEERSSFECLVIQSPLRCRASAAPMPQYVPLLDSLSPPSSLSLSLLSPTLGPWNLPREPWHWINSL